MPVGAFIADDDGMESLALVHRRSSPPPSPGQGNQPSQSGRLLAGLDLSQKTDSGPWKSCGYFSNAIVVLLAGAGIAYAAFLAFILLGWVSNGDLIEKELQAHHHLFLSFANNNSVAAHLRSLTKEPHVAGTQQNFDTADYVSSQLQGYGIQGVHFVDYPVLLSYPVSRHLLMSKPFRRIMNLEEAAIPGDNFTGNPAVMPTFHAYSPSGTATGEVVYANYGRTEDFALLAALGVNCTGKIVLTRYGKIYRGDKVYNSAKAGGVAALVYSDPQEIAPLGPELTYPLTEWLPQYGVQRGSVYSFAGDPTTPGWPSQEKGERLPPDDPSLDFPPIPSLPISYENALIMLEYLAGQDAPRPWWGGLNLTTHRLGPGPCIVTLDLQMERNVTAIRNVIATIPGTLEPDSDFGPFLQHLGLPCANLGFGDSYPMYHTMYDDYAWMAQFGDPGFKRHVAITQVWGLVVLLLADASILPFDYTTYAAELKNGTAPPVPALHAAIERFSLAASSVRLEAEVYAPALDDNYGTAAFPGITDAIAVLSKSASAASWQALDHEIWRVTRAVDQATSVLRGQVS
eukprot:jgi/Mesen1/6748/ME000344S06027